MHLRRGFTFPCVNDYRFEAFHHLSSGGAWRNQQLFLDDSLAMRKIHGQYPEFVCRRVVQRNGYGISVHHFAYIRCHRTQDLPQVEARRDSGGQIEEQLKPLVLSPKFGVCAHGRMRGIANLPGCDPNDARFRTETASAGFHRRPGCMRDGARFHRAVLPPSINVQRPGARYSSIWSRSGRSGGPTTAAIAHPMLSRMLSLKPAEYRSSGAPVERQLQRRRSVQRLSECLLAA